MSDNQIADSSFSAIINASIDKVDIPEWCFNLPEREYQGCSPATHRRGIYNCARWQTNVHQRRKYWWKLDGAALCRESRPQGSSRTRIGLRYHHAHGPDDDQRLVGDERQGH